MKYDVAMTSRAHTVLKQHLLQHLDKGNMQEDLCFALWRPSTATHRLTALVDEVLLPHNGDRVLHGNVRFTSDYMARAIMTARERQMGLAFLHSHPGTGWQDLSSPDIIVERDVLAYPTAVTKLPLVGLTIGGDGYWSARVWQREGRTFSRTWCDKIRIVGAEQYEVHFGRYASIASPRRNVLRRTFDTWGRSGQETLSRLHVGIVGLGSVGGQVAEAVARLGVEAITMIDPDIVEEHNLDRLLNASARDAGKRKVDVAGKAVRRHSTAPSVDVITVADSVHRRRAYESILGCDVIFSCVDRPLGRDVLNFVAISHLIPVIDGGIAVQINPATDTIFSAHWRAQLVTPYHRCMRCSEQYSTGAVMAELDGSLGDPEYIRNLPDQSNVHGANVFPFSQSLASMEINLMLRYLLAPSWWTTVHAQTHQLVTGETEVDAATCEASCAFTTRVAMGDLEVPFYLEEDEEGTEVGGRSSLPHRIASWLGKRFLNT